MNLKEAFEKILIEWNEQKTKPFKDNELAKFIRVDLVGIVKDILERKNSSYVVHASAGAGNWANVPWLAILDQRITNSTQSGIYPVFLFRADGSGVYLSLNQGTTNPTQELGKKVAEKNALNISNFLNEQIDTLDSWLKGKLDLKADTPLGRSYEKPNIGAKFYSAENLPENSVIEQDLIALLEIYEKVFEYWPQLSKREFSSFRTEHRTYETPSVSAIGLPKPFLLLAGISGTGKTRFVRTQAEKSLKPFLDKFQEKRNYRLVPVRPDWHEPSDLLGYLSHISDPAKYISTKVLDFIIDAWRVCAPDASENGTGELDLNVPPFWLCLDEMNLAPVEQYFADYLSVLETREYKDGKYTCDAILDKSVLEKNPETMKQDLKLDDPADDGLWAYFSNYGISLPPNLIVAGTVNMDETTHGFSRKVIDRAFSIDFGEFFPNEFDSFFEPATREKTLSFSTMVHAKPEHLIDTYDSDGHQSKDFLKSVNTILRHTPFEIAYRALNELLLYVACFKPQDERSLQAVWDDFLMTKILPRIDGDDDKLRINDEDEQTNILQNLEDMMAGSLNLIWEGVRPDFFRENTDRSGIDNIPCRSRAKIKWMKDRLETNTFTSFWP